MHLVTVAWMGLLVCQPCENRASYGPHPRNYPFMVTKAQQVCARKKVQHVLTMMNGISENVTPFAVTNAMVLKLVPVRARRKLGQIKLIELDPALVPVALVKIAGASIVFVSPQAIQAERRWNRLLSLL